MVSVHRPVHPDKLTAVNSEEWLSRRYKMPRQPFSKLCSNLLCAYLNKLPERGPPKARLCVQLWVWTIRLRSIKSSLPSLYPLCHSRDKIFQYIEDNWPMNQPDLLPIKFQIGGDQKHKLVEVA